MNAIVERTLENYHAGRKRESLNYKEMEEIIKNSAFNEGTRFLDAILLLLKSYFSGEGGLKTSRYIIALLLFDIQMIYMFGFNFIH
jgi:hypothetical protein